MVATQSDYAAEVLAADRLDVRRKSAFDVAAATARGPTAPRATPSPKSSGPWRLRG